MKKIMIKSLGLICGAGFIVSIILGVFGLLGMFVNFLCENPFITGVLTTIFFIWLYKTIEKEF